MKNFLICGALAVFTLVGGGTPAAAAPKQMVYGYWATTLCGVRQRQLHQCMG